MEHGYHVVPPLNEKAQGLHAHRQLFHALCEAIGSVASSEVAPARYTLVYAPDCACEVRTARTIDVVPHALDRVGAKATLLDLPIPCLADTGQRQPIRQRDAGGRVYFRLILEPDIAKLELPDDVRDFLRAAERTFDTISKPVAIPRGGALLVDNSVSFLAYRSTPEGVWIAYLNPKKTFSPLSLRLGIDNA